MNTQGNVSRLPVRSAHAHLPVGSVDVLPATAAASWPQHPALRGAEGTLTFAELERRISRLASGLREAIGGEGSVIAVSAVLGLDFPVAYYAIARSGNVVAPVNPRLGAEVLEPLLRGVGARAVVLNRTMYDRVRPMLARLRLEHVLLLDGPGTSGVRTCAELARRGDLLVEPRDRNENALAAIALGTGRAGYARSARQSHHGLKADAARLRTAHGLSGNAVALNALPTYQQVHLNASVLAGATQVLCGSPDPAVQAREAERYDATHHYTLVPDRRSWPAVQPLKAVAS
jgi:long-chain acyl-CoA synthetase